MCCVGNECVLERLSLVYICISEVIEVGEV